MHRLFVFIAVLVLAACTPSSNGAQADNWFHVDVVSDTGVHGFTVEIADTPEEQRRGLMYRRELAADAGMLFLYEREEPLSYWMHNTYISLDIIYIDSEGRIVSIQRNAQPLSDISLPSYEPAIAALEVNGGTADQLGFGEGDIVRHPFFEQGGGQ
jgi:uncharacterized membrane protein (UPF0127 family)